jgi:predicted PurR-regulated permease PerM
LIQLGFHFPNVIALMIVVVLMIVGVVVVVVLIVVANDHLRNVMNHKIHYNHDDYMINFDKFALLYTAINVYSNVSVLNGVLHS